MLMGVLDVMKILRKRDYGKIFSHAFFFNAFVLNIEI